MNEKITITKRIENEIKDFLSAKLSTKCMVTLFILISIWLGYNEFFRVPSLKRQIDNSNTEISKKDSEIQRLETQLTPFRTIALEKYTGSEQEALNKLTKQLESLEDKTNILEKHYNLIKNISIVLTLEFSPNGSVDFIIPNNTSKLVAFLLKDNSNNKVFLQRDLKINKISRQNYFKIILYYEIPPHDTILLNNDILSLNKYNTLLIPISGLPNMYKEYIANLKLDIIECDISLNGELLNSVSYPNQKSNIEISKDLIIKILNPFKKS